MTSENIETYNSKKRKLDAIFAVVVFIIAWCFAFDVVKITDPADPGFDPYKFKFTDYTHEELVDVLRKLFPPGVDRVFIENVLVSSGGSKVGRIGDNVHEYGGIVSYKWNLPLLYIRRGIPWFYLDIIQRAVYVKYDDNDKAIAMRIEAHGSGFNEELLDKIIQEESARLYDQHTRELLKRGTHDD